LSFFSGDEWLNVDVVRHTWNFTGVIESDCGAISGIQAHGNAKSQEGAAVAAVKATCDVECDSAYKNNLVKAEGEKKVQLAQLQAAAARVLKGRFQIGQFDPRSPTEWDSIGLDRIFSAANQQISLEGAQQSAVLLRNPPAKKTGAAHLPLKKGIRIAVIGPNSNVADVFQVSAGHPAVFLWRNSGAISPHIH
jgi:beta-glucosidase